MESSDPTEYELLKGCISGDKGKWNVFIKRYSRLIYHTIYKTLRVNDTPANSDEVNDFFQEVFTSFYANNFRKLRMFDPAKGCSLPSWLRMITVCMIVDHLRKNKPAASIDDLPDEPFQTGNQAVVIDRESLNHLRELLEELSVKDKLLVELSYIRELPAEEVARILHISVGAFYTRKNRIIEKLRKKAAEKNIL